MAQHKLLFIKIFEVSERFEIVFDVFMKIFFKLLFHIQFYYK